MRSVATCLENTIPILWYWIGYRICVTNNECLAIYWWPPVTYKEFQKWLSVQSVAGSRCQERYFNFKIVHPVVCCSVKREINKWPLNTATFYKIPVCSKASLTVTSWDWNMYLYWYFVKNRSVVICFFLSWDIF